jgi:uncharacterized protein (DUF433 family)
MPDWKQHITNKPDVFMASLAFAGRRIMVSVILHNLAEGMTPEEIVEEYPP